jgi:hypothetical protein
MAKELQSQALEQGVYTLAEELQSQASRVEYS